MWFPSYLSLYICLFVCLAYTDAVGQKAIMNTRGLQTTLQDGYIIQKRLYTTEDGLITNDIRMGIQDNDGFIWLATRNGLNRFDGKQFKLFNKQQGGLAYAGVNHIYKGANKYIFLEYDPKTSANAYLTYELFDPTTHQTISFKKAYPYLPFHPDSLIKINSEANKLYFLVAPCQVWELTGNTFTLRIDASLYIDKQKLSKHNPDKGNFTFFRNGNILLCHQTKEIPLIFLKDNHVHLIPKQYPHIGFGYFIDSEGNLCINTFRQNGKPISCRLSMQGDTLPVNTSPLCFPQKDYTFFTDSIAFSKDRTVVMRVIEGKKRYYYHCGIPKIADIVQPNVPYKSFNAFTYFNFYFEDSLGNIWLCAHYGLIKVSIRKNKFDQYFNIPIDKVKLENQARGIYADTSGNVYAAIWGSIFKKNKAGEVKIADMPNITYSLIAKNDSLYAMSDGVLVIDKNLQTLSKRLQSFSGSDMWVFYFLSDYEVLAGSSEKLEIYNIKTDRKQALYSPHFSKHMLFYRFFKDEKDILWAVAQNGFYLIKEKEIIDFYGFEANEPSHKLPCREIFDAYQDDRNKDIFWIATRNEGLYRWDKRKHSFQQFTVLDGLPSDILMRIEGDAYNYLWISTENGLCRFNRTTFLINTYTTKEGLTHNEFNRISSFKALDGRLYFGGLNGVIGFNPKDFLAEQARFDAPLRVISFQQFDGETGKIVDKTLNFLKNPTIALYPADRFLEISLQLLNYDEGENRYAYKIEGVDKDWQYITGNTLRLSGLPYGKFTLRVKAQNNWGIWSEHQLKIPIEIFAPVYLRTWFLTSAFLVIGLTIFAFIRWRTHRIRQEKMVLEKIVTQRTEELQSTLQERELLLKELHHRIKNNFSLILSFIYYQSVISEDDETVHNLNSLHQRIASISVAHDLILQSYDVDFSEDSLYIDSYLHSIAKAVVGLNKREVSLDFVVGKYLLNTDTSIPLGILLNELVSNSLKYAQPEGNLLIISIKLSVENEKIAFYFADNGVFFSEVTRSNSLGTTIINSMVKQLKGKMQRNGAHYQFYLRIKNKK